MTGKYSWIVLVVTLHISLVLCRSTEKPKDEEKVVHEGPILFPHGQASVVKSVDQYFAPNMGEPTPESPVPSNRSHVDGITFTSYRIVTLAAVFSGLIIGIICIISLFVVWIVFCCSKNEKRRPGFPSEIQQPETIAPGAPGNTQQMQRYPHQYGQSQNTYPSVYPYN